MQGFVLASALGEDHVSFAGEGELTNIVNICGLTPHWDTMPGIDLLLSRNSLPEIPLPIATAYLKCVRDRMTYGAVLFSVNHESSCGGQVSVRNMVKSATDLQCTSRYPWWPMAGNMAGYIAETFMRV